MDFRELMAYQKAFDLSMEIFTLSKSFPSEEKYSLTRFAGRHEVFVPTLPKLTESAGI